MRFINHLYNHASLLQFRRERTQANNWFDSRSGDQLFNHSVKNPSQVRNKEMSKARMGMVRPYSSETKVEAIEAATRRGVRGPHEEPTSTSSRDTSRPGTTSGR